MGIIARIIKITQIKMASARYKSFCALMVYVKEFLCFKKKCGADHRFLIEWKDRYPCLNDKTSATGFDRHYVYHTAWAARILAKNPPEEHVDISSSLYFCSLVSAFLKVRYFDYRPADLVLDNLISESADLLSLPFSDESIQSLSCMHVVEHIGLARYGDSLNPDSDLKAISELKRVLAPDGLLLFVVPVGGLSIIMFNAHRIYRYEQVMDYFSDLELKEFVLIPERPENGGLVRNPPKELIDAQGYGCGCFCFRKRSL